ncbi:MAG TPA: hypothetical protein VFU80_01255 [Sphingomicrobium sp.]|nr:hypothetical protein [Sphingomicrobium sp.]
MAGLSISRAWDETKARVAADGKLFTVVAAALIALPALVTGVMNPSSVASEPTLTTGLVFLVASIIAIIGQLAIIRLAILPGVSVGEAIGHGARRMPVYFIAAVLILIGMIAASIPFILILVASGISLEDRAAMVASPLTLVLGLLYVALICFVAIRLLMSSPVASEEDIGPIGILRRSWTLTAGHWWRLFGFIILFLIGAIILMTAISWAVGLVAVMLLGPIEAMSASALVVALVEAIVNAAVTVLLAVMLARIYLQLAGKSEAVEEVFR